MFHQSYTVFNQCTIAAILLIRTYALYDRGRRILILLAATIVVGATVAIWSVTSEGNLSNSTESILHRHGCDLSISYQQGLRLISAWASVLTFDTLVFVLTVSRAIQSNGLWRGGLLRLMVRDGAAYYGVMVIVNIAGIITNLTPVSTARGMCTSLTNVISSTLVSRIMLNIRDPKRRVLVDCRISLGGITLETPASECTHPVSEEFDDVMIIA
ncbi:hypothetical protein CERSUDRAFT_83527 [Gelatoporia subvermispora B]|uniref:Uncharacterized protein n=1 Tax=Ceriporiopsis subvermispora (strain B) TaxID=914234 RepID=M2RG10_CERS8|nr:hypothetical protein CERSUDRAFT_83527 [Gelatoporia subvermispora B]